MERFSRSILGSATPSRERQVPSPFRLRCRRSKAGGIVQKEELCPYGRNSFNYAYDAGGRLTEVRKNGLLVERYEYDPQGRRIGDFRSWDGEPRSFIYNYDGALIRVNDCYLTGRLPGN